MCFYDYRYKIADATLTVAKRVSGPQLTKLSQHFRAELWYQTHVFILDRQKCENRDDK